MAQAKVRRMFEVKSEMIHKIGFDYATPGDGCGFLVVQFANNFKAYGYQNVLWTDYFELANAVSVGSAFVKHIKDEYKGELLSSGDQHLVAQTELSAQQSKAAVDTFEVGRASSSRADDVPFLDVMGVDSDRGVGKMSSTVRRKK